MRVYRGNIGIMEKKMETTITDCFLLKLHGLGLRV